MPFGPGTEQIRRALRNVVHLFTRLLCPPKSFWKQRMLVSGTVHKKDNLKYFSYLDVDMNAIPHISKWRMRNFKWQDRSAYVFKSSCWLNLFTQTLLKEWLTVSDSIKKSLFPFSYHSSMNNYYSCVCFWFGLNLSLLHVPFLRSYFSNWLTVQVPNTLEHRRHLISMYWMKE